jgi:hypothetical protein
MAFLSSILPVEDLVHLVFRMCNPIVLVRLDMIDFPALVEIGKQCRDYICFPNLMNLVIVKWHSQFTEQLIIKFFNEFIFEGVGDCIFDYYILDKLTLSVINKFNKDVRCRIKRDLVIHTILKDVDKGIDMVRKTKYWTLINDIYTWYPTPEVTYKIYSMLLTVPNLDDDIILNSLDNMKETITPMIEDLFRKHNKYHLLSSVLDPWPYEDHSMHGRYSDDSRDSRDSSESQHSKSYYDDDYYNTPSKKVESEVSDDSDDTLPMKDKLESDSNSDEED